MLRHKFRHSVSVLNMKLHRVWRTVTGVFSLTPTWLTGSTLLCLCIIIVNALVWDAMPEPFNGAATLAAAGIDLLLAYVAGYIFYVLTTVATEYKKQQFIYFTVMVTEITNIARSYSYLLCCLANKNYISVFDVFDIYASKESLPLLLASTDKLSIDDAAPLANGMTWLEYLAGVCRGEDQAIHKMLRYDIELELEVRSLLVTLLDTDYKQLVDIMSDPKNKDEDRSFKPIVGTMHSHMMLLSKLQNNIYSVIAGRRL